LCGEGFTCGGTKSNASFAGNDIRYADGMGEDMIGLLNDPQTSGGLLISVPPERLDEMVSFLTDFGTLAAAVIGEATEFRPDGPWLDFKA